MCFKYSIIFLVVFITLATGLDESQYAKILKYEFTHDTPGSYAYLYENSDGQSKEEKGEHADTVDFVVRGSYTYLGADGVTYTVNYYADKDGFHPSGDHIKVPPYTPWPVNRVLTNEEGKYSPEVTYSEKPSNSLESQQNIYIPSSTPQPPRPTVSNAYIPSTPSASFPQSSQSYNYDQPKQAFNSKLIANTYIPSTPSPFVKDVTVSPLNYAASSTTIKIIPRNRTGRARNVEAFKKAQNDLFEVIQNNHSSQGVFKDK